ncbi:creatininase family protein [Halospeciosus flavus]|uniref:Creatininase family protein n=1 Tax=Halospeciosus flavus TaxID=3032283 RepID=A0ABD5Z0Q1_9EURY|nr:creatininase family protein [Halospeciosus flavus]
MNDDADEPTYRLAELTWREVEAALEETRTLLLPVGSVEQHGHHLPLGVDVQMPEAVAERVAARTDCLLAPAIPYGVSPHHTFKPGTFTVESETFQHYVRDVCASAGEWGVENVLLLNGHYLAQDPELDVVVRTLRTEHDLRAFHVPLSDVWAETAEEGRTGEPAFHAAEFETSVLLALRPDLVSMDEAVPVEVPDESLPLTDYDAYGENRVGWALSADDMADLTHAGNLGDPRGATAEFGERLVETAVSNVATLVEALDA